MRYFASINNVFTQDDAYYDYKAFMGYVEDPEYKDMDFETWLDEYYIDGYEINEITEEEYIERRAEEEEPDWIDGAPNYDKYPGLTTEQVLVMYNID